MRNFCQLTRIHSPFLQPRMTLLYQISSWIFNKKAFQSEVYRPDTSCGQTDTQLRQFTFPKLRVWKIAKRPDYFPSVDFISVLRQIQVTLQQKCFLPKNDEPKIIVYLFENVAVNDKWPHNTVAGLRRLIIWPSNLLATQISLGPLLSPQQNHNFYAANRIWSLKHITRTIFCTQSHWYQRV